MIFPYLGPYLGPHLGRREDARLLTGAGRYTADSNLPDQLYGVFLRADRAHADIGAVQAEAARATPEAALAPAAAAIHAVLDALAVRGVRHLEMPATAQRVWQAVEDAR